MVTRVTPEIRESIDWYIDALRGEWDHALDVVRNPGESLWGDPETLFAEWFLAISHLVHLLRLQQQGFFSSDQERRFEELRCFMRAHEHELEAVLGPGGVTLDPRLD